MSFLYPYSVHLNSMALQSSQKHNETLYQQQTLVFWWFDTVESTTHHNIYSVDVVMATSTKPPLKVRSGIDERLNLVF